MSKWSELKRRWQVARNETRQARAKERDEHTEAELEVAKVQRFPFTSTGG